MFDPVAGADFGKHGCFCLVKDMQNVTWFRVNGRTVFEYVKEIRGHFALITPCYVEDLNYRPGDANKVNAMMTMMRAAGQMEGALAMAGYVPLSAAGWQREFRVQGKAYEDRKKSAHEIAQKLLGKRVTKDAADGILIAIYGWRKENGLLTGGKDPNFISRIGTGVISERISDLG